MIDLIVLLAVSTCLVLALTIGVKGWASHFHRSVVGVLLGAAGVCVGEWVVSVPQAVSGLGSVLCFISELLLVVMLFHAVTEFDRELDRGSKRTRYWRYMLAITAVGLSIWIVVVLMLDAGESRDRLIGGMGLTGNVTYLFLVIIYVVSIAYLEGLLRTLRDPVLYQLKFVLIGLVALAGFRIFALSQTVFQQGQRLDAATNGLAILMVIGLVAYGFMRAKFQSLTERIYISPKVLSGSLTFLVVGLYLFGVGAVSQIVRSLGVSFGVALSVLFVLLALMGLMILVLSRSSRMTLRTMVARNFYRSKYDYRAQWLEVTEVFRERDSVDAIWDGLLGLLSRTFSAGRISVWHKIEADGRFHQMRSTNTESPPEPLGTSHGLIQRLAGEDVPVDLAVVGLPLHDNFVRDTQAVLCAPIHSEAELIGFIALSSEVAGLSYEQDDRDLLKAIAHHVGVLLAHARLSEERQSSAELEALHRFSAFCLHDLKNLAARLSLVAQNAEHHGHDPAFQESAMRTVKDTTHKITTLMSKLSAKSAVPSLAGTWEQVELSGLIEEIVAPLRGGRVRWHISTETTQSIAVIREEINQVLLNVMLNAKQAISEEGDIWITLSRVPGFAVVTIEDTGCGISQERLRPLFQPAQSSRPGGLGIGLFQCHQIVEAYGGVIQIQSELGRGTTVRIEFPSSLFVAAQSRLLTAHSVVSP